MPSDALRNASGRIGLIRGLERIAPGHTDLLRSHLATLDGFGLRPVIEFPIDGEIDPTSLEGDALFLLDDSGARIAMDWRWEPARSTIVGSPRPGRVLRERTRYVAVLTRDVRAADGTRIGAAQALDRVDAPEILSDVEVEVAAFAAFTTAGPSEGLVAARARLDDRSTVAAPRIEIGADALVFSSTAALDRLLGRPQNDPDARPRWGWTRTGVAHAHVGAVVHGALHRTRFRRDDTGDDEPDDETFELDDTGAPVPVAVEPIPVTIILPAAPPPSAGYPAVILGHGLGASRHAMLTFAEPLAEAGYALVGIDMESHGSRFSALDEANNTAMVADAFEGQADMADGFGDRTGPITTLSLLEGLQNLSAVRDSFRQSVLDLSQLAIALKSGAVEGLEAELDASKLAYLGESFGAVIGGVLAGVEPLVDLYVLNVGGGGVIDLIIPSSPILSSLLEPLGRSVYEIEGRFDRFHPVVGLAQMLIDPADPLTFAPHYFRERLNVGPRHVVILEVIGDELMSNVGTEALGRAGGFGLLDPHYAPIEGVEPVTSPAAGNVDGQTGVIVQYAPATHGANWSSDTGMRRFTPEGQDGERVALAESVTIRNPIRETFEQVIEVLRTHREGAPSVRSTFAPRRDFDDDGVSDDEERAAGRDPYAPG